MPPTPRGRRGTTINVHALDARSFDRYPRGNRGSVVKLPKGAGRDYAIQMQTALFTFRSSCQMRRKNTVK